MNVGLNVFFSKLETPTTPINSRSSSKNDDYGYDNDDYGFDGYGSDNFSYETPKRDVDDMIQLTPATPIQMKDKSETREDIQQKEQENPQFDFANYSTEKFALAVIRGDLTAKGCNEILKLKNDPKFNFQDVKYNSYQTLLRGVEENAAEEV